mmetsp:Transcript_10974/g.27626  ORF Transcript_10974/g.27626 Transcript_10974/m.27626 type:complete len:299 (-) Transcript_10974:6-902(-)
MCGRLSASHTDNLRKDTTRRSEICLMRPTLCIKWRLGRGIAGLVTRPQRHVSAVVTSGEATLPSIRAQGHDACVLPCPKRGAQRERANPRPLWEVPQSHLTSFVPTHKQDAVLVVVAAGHQHRFRQFQLHPAVHTDQVHTGQKLTVDVKVRHDRLRKCEHVRVAPVHADLPERARMGVAESSNVAFFVHVPQNGKPVFRPGHCHALFLAQGKACDPRRVRGKRARLLHRPALAVLAQLPHAHQGVRAASPQLLPVTARLAHGDRPAVQGLEHSSNLLRVGPVCKCRACQGPQPKRAIL